MSLARVRVIVCIHGLAVAASAVAQVDPIGYFTGDFQEGFETQCPCPGPFFCVPGGVFGGMASLCADQGFIAPRYEGACVLRPHAGTALFGIVGRPVVGATFTFGEPVRRFGAFFAQAHGGAGGVQVTLLDAGGAPIERLVVNFAGDCAWRWAGWSSTVRIGAVHILGFRTVAPFQVTAEFQLDDAQADAAVCYPDCDTSTGRAVLDVFDFLCFQNAFVAAEPYACECDTHTGPEICDVFDFLCFQNRYAAGCP